MASQKLIDPAMEQEREEEVIEDKEKSEAIENTEVSEDKARPRASKKLPKK